MARFYLTASNSRGNTVTAMGAARGQDCHLRGWNVGVEVFARPERDGDAFDVYATGGSNDPHASTLIGTVRLGEDGAPTFEPAELLPPPRTEQDATSGRWYVVADDGTRLHGPYLSDPAGHSVKARP